MKQIVKILAWIAVIFLILPGTVFALQGVGILPGSIMTGQTKWLIIGAIMDVIGLAIAVVAWRFGSQSA